MVDESSEKESSKFSEIEKAKNTIIKNISNQMDLDKATVKFDSSWVTVDNCFTPEQINVLSKVSCQIICLPVVTIAQPAKQASEFKGISFVKCSLAQFPLSSSPQYINKIIN